MNKLLQLAALWLGLAFIQCAANAAPITYIVNESFGGGSITGDIVTDGTIGTINLQSGIAGWNLTLNNGTHSSTLDGANSHIFAGSTSFQFLATAAALTFDHTFGNYFFIVENNFAGGWCLEGPGDGCQSGASTSNFFVDVGGSPSAAVYSAVRTQSVFLADAPAQAPEPASFALLGLGLAGLGFGRRNKA